MPSLKTVIDSTIAAAEPLVDEMELFRNVLNQAGMLWGGERVTGGSTDSATMVDDRLDSWSDYRTVANKDVKYMYRTVQPGEILHFVWNNGTAVEAHSVIIYAVDRVNGVITAFDNEGVGDLPRLFELKPETIQGPVQVQTFDNSLPERLRGDIKDRIHNYIDGGDGNDTIDGALGNDTLIGGSGDDSLIGGYGDDRLEGGFGNDTLTATAGDDVLIGGGGLDRLIGGSGKDNFVFSRVTDTRLSTALVFNSMDTLINIDFGGNGRATADSVELPYTVASVASGGVVKTGGISFYSAVNFLFARGQPLYDTNKAGLFSYLGEVYLIVSGPARSNNLGADDFIFRVQGFGGVLDASDFGYTYTTTNAAGRQQVNTTSVSATLSDTQDDLVYLGTAGNFAGTGNSRANSITGGAGNDTLDGGTGADTLVGGLGDDTYVLDSIGDLFTELPDEGKDTIRTSLATFVLTDVVENLSFTGAQAATGTGNAADNSIVGGAGNDTLTGLAGNDTLDGGVGADSLTGGAGNDIYVVDDAGDVVVEAAAGGTDTVRSKLAAYTLAADLEHLAYVGTGAFAGTGNALDNSITGALGEDTLVGGAGSDTLDGGAGIDQLAGGVGNDTYVVNAGNDLITELAGEGTDTVRTTLATYTLAAELEDLIYAGTASFAGIGNAAANSITGGGGVDTLTGAAGNDTLDGGAGADSLVGGVGDDVYLVDNVGDLVVEAAGEGTDTVRTTAASLTLAANVENLVNAGTDGFAGTGNAAANSIAGAEGDDTLNGGGGSDTLAGGAGDDIYVIIDGTETIVEAAGAGTDTVRTALASFTLGVELDDLTHTGTVNFAGTGNAGFNSIIGGVGADTLTGLAGNDTLDGGAGADSLVGGAGDDLYVIDDVGDVIVEAAGEGTDIVRTTLASFTLTADLEYLHYIGTAAFSGAGNVAVNRITGGVGSDTLTGGGGADTLTGGGGADRFVLLAIADSAVATPVVIADFSAAAGDRIDLSAIDANSATPADDAFTFLGLGAFTNVAGQLRLQAAGTDMLLLGDVNGDGVADFAISLLSLATLTAGDVVL